ncbi:DNA-processing protein DprA [Paucibacter sp. JuS9]|uniref:DNA-processing protein DprA n=1 Tax=Paucibacter sp. JuS9 TaxID=3228748 RepID=UPI003756D2B2
MGEMKDLELTVAILALIRAGKASPAVAVDFLRKFSENGAGESGVDAVLAAFGTSQPSVNASLSSSRRDLEGGLEKGVMPIPLCSDRYPASLRLISDPPPILYVRGKEDALSRLPGVAVVGTRNASQHGLTIAQRIAKYLSDNDWVVVSGLALGVDASAHEGALLGRTPTIAVLAHGLERASPRANEPLAMRILEAGGLWVSEHAVGVSARPEYFVHRNRIQVGLSSASVIVEGELKSGSATQAEYCMRYRRELFAVLPDSSSPVSTQSQLPRMLVKQRGAHAIVSRESYPELLDAAARKRSELLGTQ